MHLREYLLKKEMKMSDFAKKIGYTPNYVSAVTTGRAKPTRKFIQIVFMVTKTHLTFGDIPMDTTKN